VGSLDEYLTSLAGLSDEDRQATVQAAVEATKDRRWIPNPGPQTDAYFCEADELLYGGEAGGGKTDLVAGLSLTEHKRSLVLRRTNGEAVKLFDRFQEIIGNRNGLNEQKGTWRIDGRIIDIGGCQLENDKQKRKGIAHDLKAFDELVDFTKTQYEFIITWNRSTDPGQRCRIVATTNPPTRPEGMWVVERWAPWLDPKHPNPAKSGELRWFTTINGRDTEVDGPGPHLVDGKEVMAKSRCFIRAKLDDNPDLTQTDDYASRLDALPKELREAYREGRFDVGLKDAPFQAIPTDWIRAAQDRWHEKPPLDVPMCAIGVDCSGGGDDPMVMAPRYDGWFAPLVVIPGKDIPQDRAGRFGAGMIITERRNSAIVVVDMGGGYGGSIFEHLKDNDVQVVAHKGAEASVQRTKDGQLGFFNKRTQVIWRFREALDPSQVGGSPIMLPPDPMLLADLAAPTFWLNRDKIQVEPKEDVCKRLSRSTDRGDAVVESWSAGPTYITNGDEWARQAQENRPLGRRPQVVMGRNNRR
jgi:hypothetical protein